MAKTLLEAFEEVFSKEVRSSRNYSEAYQKAASNFQNAHGFSAFEGYDSFRKKKERSKKK